MPWVVCDQANENQLERRRQACAELLPRLPRHLSQEIVRVRQRVR
jgi:hypothetical protein